jgi:hypothetical protein
MYGWFSLCHWVVLHICWLIQDMLLADWPWTEWSGVNALDLHSGELGLNLGWHTDYPACRFSWFSRSLQADTEIVKQVNNDSFLSNPFKFISHLTIIRLHSVSMLKVSLDNLKKAWTGHVWDQTPQHVLLQFAIYPLPSRAGPPPQLRTGKGKERLQV